MDSIMFPFWALWVFFPLYVGLSRHHQPIGNWLDNVSLWHIIHFFAEAKFSHNIRIASTYSRALWCVCVCVRSILLLPMIYWQCHFYYIILYIWFRLTSVFIHCTSCGFECISKCFFSLLLFQIVCPPYKVRIDCEKFHHRKNSFKTNVIQSK